MGTTSNKRKKKKNPLAQARGQQKSNANIWFRRTGAGFHLFLDYYANQPLGTVCGDGDASSDNSTDKDMGGKTAGGNGSENRDAGAAPRGGSRAAKRRRKKQRTNQQNTISCEQNKGNSDDKTANGDFTMEPSSPRAGIISPSAASKNNASPNRPNPLMEAFHEQQSKQQKSPNNKNNHNNNNNNNLAALTQFVEHMSRPLPLTIRIRRTADLTAVQAKLDAFHEICQPVAWNPRIYQMAPHISKQSINSDNTFKQFLLEQAQNGNLARQELGSMLPVLALEQVGAVTPGSRVLDVCASPGSKTLQALEIVNQRGKVLANDVLESRLDALRDAVGRAGLPEKLVQKRIVYSCQDATRMVVSGSSNNSSRKKKPWDAVICDVPCSGDGTIRKDAHVLPMFKPNAGNDLHSTQLGILKRALHLVKPGGVVCYSTCTLNPVEDEAVVAAAINSSSHNGGGGGGGMIELLDWEVPEGFTRRPGISTWNVAEYVDDADDDDGNKNDDCDDHNTSIIDNDDDDDDDHPKLRWHDSYAAAGGLGPASLWPPPTTTNSESCPLHKCTRLWPQDHNSGGFFLALLRKQA